MTSCNPKGQACKPDIGYLRLNIATTVQTAAMGQIPRSIECILVSKKTDFGNFISLDGMKNEFRFFYLIKRPTRTLVHFVPPKKFGI